MNLRKKNRFVVLGVVLLWAAASSHAMTLGRARGAVLLGQPLKLSVPIQLESGEGLSALCFDAEVFYGDTRQDASRVAVTIEQPQSTQTAGVAVTSSANVDEPVVTVYLRAGCEYKSTRRFVLLADLATEVQQSVLNRGGAVQSLPLEGVPKNQSEAVISAVKPLSVKRRASVASEPRAEAVALQTPVPAQKRPPVRRPRLQLSPVDLTVERDPALKLSNELHFGEAENLQKRAEFAALWRSLNANPQDILNEESRRQSMETDLKGLQVATAKNKQTLQELSSRLEAAEAQRYSNPLVYGLISVLVLFSLGLAYLVFRMRQGGQAALPWWGDEEFPEKYEESSPPKVDDDPHAPGSRGVLGEVQVSPEARPKPVVEKVTTGLTEVDIDLYLGEPSIAKEHDSSISGESSLQTPAVGSVSRGTGHADFAHSMTGNLRSINTQEMLDVRQQADFFMTLGQHDEALGVLKDCVDGSTESNPLVYLDLLRILHSLGRKAEFDYYRSEFNSIFSGQVPIYTAFNHGGEGLEAYPDICRTIEALWPSESAITYIEKCLVRDVSGDAKQGMELDAFRDLLMLHGTAGRIASGSDSGLLPFIASRVSSMDQGVGAPAPKDEPDLTQATQPLSVDGIDIGNLSVDIDLPQEPGNLIDFDAYDFSLPEGSSVRKP